MSHCWIPHEDCWSSVLTDMSWTMVLIHKCVHVNMPLLLKILCDWQMRSEMCVNKREREAERKSYAARRGVWERQKHKHSWCKDESGQIGDTGCSKAGAAIIVLRTQTALICSPGSQRVGREGEREREAKEREHTDCLRLAFNVSMTAYAPFSLSFSPLLLIGPPLPPHL